MQYMHTTVTVLCDMVIRWYDLLQYWQCLAPQSTSEYEGQRLIEHGTAACKYASKLLKTGCASYTERARSACFVPVMQHILLQVIRYEPRFLTP